MGKSAPQAKKFGACLRRRRKFVGPFHPFRTILRGPARRSEAGTCQSGAVCGGADPDGAVHEARTPSLFSLASRCVSVDASSSSSRCATRALSSDLGGYLWGLLVEYWLAGTLTLRAGV